MTMWFTNGWLRLGSKKRVQRSDDSGSDTDKENADRPAYPTMKKAKKKETPLFEGATPGDTGSWLLLQDQEGRMYWWNDVTGQWTYQLYGAPQQQNQGYPHLQQHHHQQQMMAPVQRVSYTQQHTAHLTHHHYNPNSLQHNSPPLGPVSPPHMWQQQQQQQQQQWGLLSPSAHGSGAALPASTAVGFGGFGWGLSSSDEEDEDEEEEEEVEAWAAEKKAGGTWDKFFDGRGLPVWIHSKTGSRTSVNPATV
eukprot:g14755.t1